MMSRRIVIQRPHQRARRPVAARARATGKPSGGCLRRALIFCGAVGGLAVFAAVSAVVWSQLPSTQARIARYEARSEAAIQQRLAYLGQVPEVSAWRVERGNEVRIDFRTYSSDLRVICAAAGFHARRAAGLPSVRVVAVYANRVAYDEWLRDRR